MLAKLIQLYNVQVHYKESERPALSEINLSFQQGEFVCILGQSGAGKSTLLRTINGLQLPSNGEVFWHDTSLHQKNEEQLRKVRREMGMIFQHFNLIPRLTVLQNVLTGLFGYRSSFKSLIGWFTKQELEEAANVIDAVGLTEQIYRRVEKLSGGQKQRVGIARSILQKPKLLLGDEPVSSLDPGTANQIFKLLWELHETHNLLTILNVHDVQLAKKYASRIIALKEGRVVFDGKPADFLEEDFVNTYETNGSLS
ncbi:phosphonate ABC transporter ATP-binding protein [Radiobacillus deserti]|uniref:Phosphonate ABC transporter ATP-binding protein n=1 Tax=Radiobacillus deserti TaxID=2594883 RepID=A0A516KIE0_9BACI|nr:phosphonate ABC transporter ATP-binding protein [Radiobacillus deserti]QDP41149.1 phosphonate ABC transporter ATP-binding protein [Radiobacillus deserti]